MSKLGWPSLPSFVVLVAGCNALLDTEGYHYIEPPDPALVCADGERGGDETDVDCGGICPPCVDGKGCAEPADCESGRCLTGTCCPDACATGCDATGACGGCGVPSPAPGADGCPPICTGGCAFRDDSRTCIIACTTSGPCQGAAVICPSTWACEVQCTEVESCRDASIACPAEYGCEVRCEGEKACEGATIACDDGLCTLTCASGVDVCRDTSLQCGPQACTASCQQPEFPNVICGPACSCTPC